MATQVSFNSLFREKPIPVPSELEVNLTPKEDQLCTLLDECKQHLASKGQSVECRISGGWVRDKLLGAQSNDIDIALSNIMGVSFAEQFVKFVKSKDLPVKTVATIARNPEQSKHLETARTTVLDTEIDFVNLRSESYADNSRIPTEIKLGTPLEDALRRDATINAMFYNVHTRSVEDLTEKGLDDLRNGIIRTPMTPFETFRDDPLRVLRCIRFASRFGFKLVEEVEESMQNVEIQAAIVSKISRERIGEELDKMMKGRDPLHSIRLIASLDLYSSITAVPASISSTFTTSPASTSSALGAAIILHAALSSSFSDMLRIPSLHPLLLSHVDRDKTLCPRLFLATLMMPYADVQYLTPKKKTRAPAVEVVIREGLKLGLQNHYADGVPAFFAAAEVLRGVEISNFEGPNERSRIGSLLRTKSVHNANTGSHWTSSILFTIIRELTTLWDASKDTFDVERAAPIVDRFNRFLQRVQELKLPDSIDDKPLLNGNEIVWLLGATRPGVWTGSVLARVSEWALDHPEGTKDACAAWLKAEHEAGRIDIGNISAMSAKGHRAKKPKVTDAS
ncbi:CCA1 [Sanghuangporus sanghuang]